MNRTTLTAAALAVLLTGTGIAADERAAHEHHHHQASSSGSAANPAMAAHESDSGIEDSLFRVTKVIPAPENFTGGLAWDPENQRLWLLSVGPPANTKTSSTLYRVDPNDGKILAQAKMPFLGEFGAPVYANGHLYVGIPHASKLYKIAISDASFGEIVQTVPLPTLNDIDVPLSEPFRYPFVNFPGLVFTPDNKLLLHAEDLGLFLTVDPETGRLLKTARTLKGLGGTAGVSGPQNDELLVLGNSDPEMTLLKRDMRVFMFRSAHGFTPPYAVRTEEGCGRVGARDITWTLLEASSGEVLASTLDRCSRTKANSVALVKQEPAAGFYYGRLTFMTVADEGILTVEWRPR